MAVQGVRDATVLLHGPEGCRGALLPSLGSLPREGRRPAGDPHYAGSAGVPHSGVLHSDFAGMTQERYDAALSRVSGEGYRLVVPICSPGTLVYSDELRGGDRVVPLDTEALGPDAPTGFDRAIRTLLENSGEPRGIVPGTVNVLGLSIMHKDWPAVKAEMEHVLSKAGLRVLCAPGAGCTADELAASLSAEYCVVVGPEHCRETAALYEGLGSEIICTGDSPVGFDAVEALYGEIEESAGVRMPGARNMLAGCKRRAHDCIRASGRDMAGASFSVEAVPSVRRPLAEWLESSLGMVEEPGGEPDVLFAPGHRAAQAEASGECLKGVDMGFPSGSMLSFEKKPVLGQDGAMHLLEEVFSCRLD